MGELFKIGLVDELEWSGMMGPGLVCTKNLKLGVGLG